MYLIFLHPDCCQLSQNITKCNRFVLYFSSKIVKQSRGFVFETLKRILRKNLIVDSIIQEKLKEKESRKTQTFKKDDDKKKKLMQVEVQVGQALWHVCGRTVSSNVCAVMASVFNVKLYYARFLYGQILQNVTANALISIQKIT